jgi:DivIVA domain-containing protein
MKHHRFHRVSRLRRGYHRRQVDAFLQRIEVSLTGIFPPPTAAEVRQAGFELVHGGYDVAAVDAHLDALEERAMLAQAKQGGRRGRWDPAGEAAILVKELTGPYMKRFPRTGALRRGYDVDDVDELVDRVLAGLDGSAGRPPTVEDVRRAPFRPRRGGYREDAVDDALDRVVEHLLLVQRSAPPQQFPLRSAD